MTFEKNHVYKSVLEPALVFSILEIDILFAYIEICVFIKNTVLCFDRLE